MELHRYIIGQTGTGKSTALLNLILQDIHFGRGVFFVDFHGHDTDTLLSRIPEKNAGKVIYFDPLRLLCPINVIENIEPEMQPFVASSLLDTFRSVFGYTHIQTPKFDQTIYNAIFAVLNYPGASLLDVHYFLSRKKTRELIAPTITDPVVADFWEDFEDMTGREQRDLTNSSLNKTGYLLSDIRLRRILGYPHSSFSLSDVLNGAVFIARIPQGQLGIQKASILASLLLGQLHAALLSRTNDLPVSIYLDECHLFAEGTMTEMLTGIRKFNASLTLAHQYLDQLSNPLRTAIFGNVGTKIVFRLGPEDAEKLRYTELAPDNVYEAVDELPRYTARISSDNLVYDSRMPPLPDAEKVDQTARILEINRIHHSKSAKTVDRTIEKTIKSLR